MSLRISGKEFDVALGGSFLHIETATLDITDNTAVAKNDGIPNGHTRGDVEASGEIVLDAKYVTVILREAKAAGSFQALEPMDMLFYAKTNSSEEIKVEAFGCKLSVSSLLNIDSNSTDKSTITIPYIVTSPHFVRINGVPYLDPAESADLIY